MKKYIKIEWDDKLVKEEHTEGVTTFELISILETTKLNMWEHRILKEEQI